MTSVSLQFKAFVDLTLSPKAQSEMVAGVARKTLAEVIADGRGTKDYRKFVDGREGAAEETVRPDGSILYRFSHLGQAGKFALDTLITKASLLQSSKITKADGKIGHYKDSFFIAVDGSPIRASSYDPDRVPQTAELVIYNINAYSRKLDIQLVGGKVLNVKNVSPFMFEDTVGMLKRKYGGMFEVKRAYTMSVPGQYVLQNEQTHKSGKPRGRKGGKVETPAIIIKPLG